MIARDLFRIVLRRWYLMVVGAAVSLLAVYWATNQPPVYWTQFSVVLLAPVEEFYPNQIEDARYALAPMAGVVVSEWNRDHRPTLRATGETTLYGEGIRKGVQVRMPNQGSQWRPVYIAPNIDVQVVAETPGEVLHESARVRDELDDLLISRQEALDVSPRWRITTIAAPREPTVRQISGSRPRTALATGLVGAIVTTIVVYWVDRLVTIRASAKRRRTIVTSSSASDMTGSSVPSS